MRLCKHGFSTYFQIDKNNQMTLGSDSVRIFNNNPTFTLSLDKLRIIKSLLQSYKILNDKQRKKIEPYFELIKVKETKGNPKGIRCAIMVTILESLFSNNDEKSEIRYRFPLRMTKQLKGDYDLDFKYIKKLYDYRSAYYHTGKDKFNGKDEAYLNIQTKKFLIEFIKHPEHFEGKEFDKKLLGQ